jgi:hypothetical protein
MMALMTAARRLVWCLEIEMTAYARSSFREAGRLRIEAG